MRDHKDALFAAILGFGLTSSVLLPPVLEERAERAARIADHDERMGAQAVPFGKDRQARLAGFLRNKSPEGAATAENKRSSPAGT